MGQRKLVSGGAIAVTIGFAATSVSLAGQSQTSSTKTPAAPKQRAQEHLDARSHTLGASGPARCLGLPKRDPCWSGPPSSPDEKCWRLMRRPNWSGRRSKT